MPDTKISALTDGLPAQATDKIPAARAGANVRITAQDIANLATSTPSDFQPAIVTGNLYGSKLVNSANNDAIFADFIIAYPIWFSRAETWSDILILVNTASGSATEKIRLGIYANGADNKPGALILDTGELSLNNTGILAATINQALSANTLYWVAEINNDPGTTTVVSGVGANALDLALGNWVLGNDYSLSGSELAQPAFYKSQAYGALPDPFGTPDGYFDYFTCGAAPAIWLRKV